jgi:antitoxin component YwqK of YwqJK toxin-antitoxin module
MEVKSKTSGRNTANSLFRRSILVCTLATSVWCQAQEQHEHVDLGHGAAMLDEANKRYSEADTLGALERLGRVEPNDSLYERAVLSSVHLLNDMSDHAEAERLCRVGIALDGAKAGSFKVIRAATLLDMDLYEASLAASDSVIAEYPGIFRPHHLKAIAYGEAGDKVKALEQAMENARRFPYQREAHILLTTIAGNEGRTSQAALAAVMAQLVRFDDGMAENLLQYYDGLLGGTMEADPDGYDLSLTGDHLKELDQLIASKIAMDKKYQVKPDLTYPMCRQSHLLFSEVSKMDFSEQGFYVQFYGPVVKSIMEEGLFEGFVYHCLNSSTADKVKSIATKNRTKVNDFRARLVDIIEKHYLRFPEPDATEEIYHVYNDGGDFVAMGPTDEKADKSLGEWTYYAANGRLISQGGFNNEGNKEGTWNYWYDNGKPRSTAEYSNDIKNGALVTYYVEGGVQDSVMYKDGLREGKGCSYRREGGLETCKVALADKWTGPVTEYHPSGAEEWRYDIVDDQAEGDIKQYYADGTVQFEGRYAAGQRVGKFTEYHKNGQKSLEQTYVDGKSTGPFTKWYASGVVKEEGTTLNNFLTGERRSYDEWGTLSGIAHFDEQGRSNGLNQEFDRDGRPYIELEYRNDLLIRYSYKAMDGTVLGEAKRAKGKFDFTGYFPEGQKKVTGTYLDEGAKDGPWVYYFQDGTMKSDERHADGELSGKQRFFSEDGTLASENDGYERNGNDYRSFIGYHPSGAVKEVGQLKNDEFEGVDITYEPDGSVSTRSYFVDGDREGTQYYYDPTGVLNSSDVIRGGITTEQAKFDDKGVEYERVLIPAGAFVVVHHHPNGSVSSRLEKLNGVYHGKALWTYPDGTKEVEGTFLNGDRQGAWTYYHPNGKKRLEQEYRLGDLVGNSTAYFPDGTKQSVYPYQNGQVHGTVTEFHANGKPSYVREHEHDVRHGRYASYSWEGVPQMVRFYVKGDLVAYGSPAADGSVADTVKLGTGLVQLESHFPDGTVSRRMTYRNGEIDGAFKEYHPNGKVMEEMQYKVGKAMGEKKSYYPSGQLMEEVMYSEGMLHGVQKRYWENGKLKETKTFVYGEGHGPWTVHDNTGRVLATYTMRDDDIVGIKK